MSIVKILRGAVVLAVLSSLSGPVCGQSLNSVVIWPVKPVIKQGERATLLRLENPGKKPLLMQVRIFAWEQKEGEDKLTAQKEVTGTPPMVQIEPGQVQVIRLTQITPVPAGREHAYRVIIDEIPIVAPAAGADGSEKDGAAPSQIGPTAASIRFRMRYSLPLFSYGGAASDPSRTEAMPTSVWQWRVIESEGKSFLEISNGGTKHGRLNSVSDNDEKGGASVLEGVNGYVLAGGVMRWPLHRHIAQQAKLVAAADDGTTVVLAPSGS